MPKEEKESIIKGIEQIIKSKVYGDVIIAPDEEGYKVRINAAHMYVYYNAQIPEENLYKILNGEYSVRQFVLDILEDYKGFLRGYFFR